jgi:hypothetical protein
MLLRLTACLVALTLLLASVTDNAATCRDDIQATTEDDSHRAPPTSPQDMCPGMNCQSPGEAPAPLLARGLTGWRIAPVLPRPMPASIDAAAPPTPPPNAAT